MVGGSTVIRSFAPGYAEEREKLRGGVTVHEPRFFVESWNATLSMRRVPSVSLTSFTMPVTLTIPGALARALISAEEVCEDSLRDRYVLNTIATIISARLPII